MARNNYGACSGAGMYINKTNGDGTPAPSPLDGLFGVTFIPGWNTTYASSQYTGSWKIAPGTGIPPAAVHDGLSNTMAVSEVTFINSQAEGRGSWAINMPGAASFMAKTRPNALGTNSTYDAYDVVPMCDMTIAAQQPHALHAGPLERQHLGRCPQSPSDGRECLEGRWGDRLRLQLHRHGGLASDGDHLQRGNVHAGVLGVQVAEVCRRKRDARQACYIGLDDPIANRHYITFCINHH